MDVQSEYFPFVGGVLCHLVFNRLEPRKISNFVFLLVICPILLGCFQSGPQGALFLTLLLKAWAKYLLALICSTTIYRLSPLHPLARYPGPVWCKISKLWLASVAATGKQHVYIRKLHKRYGDVIRVGPNELSFAEASYISPMMGINGLPKGPFWDGQFPDQKTNRTLVGLRDPSKHVRLRRLWSKAFTADALKYYNTLVEKRIGQLIEALEEREGQVVEMGEWLKWWSHDTMSDIAYGSGPEMLRNQDSAIWKLLEEATQYGMVFAHAPWLGEFYLQIPYLTRQFHEFRTYCYERTSTRYEVGSPHKDLFYYLMDEEGNEAEKPELEQVINDAVLAIVAGSDTVSTALPSLLSLLLRHPTALMRLRRELEEAGNKICDTTVLAKLPYLGAVINESLRLFPPVLSGSPRAPLIGGPGHQLGAWFVPEGTSTYVHTYTIQRDPRYFQPLPDNFIPERWLSEEAQITLEPGLFCNRSKVVHQASVFIPFSTGPMDCIGKRLAMQEMRMVVARVLMAFDLQFGPGHDPGLSDREIKDYFVTQRGKLPLILRKRILLGDS